MKRIAVMLALLLCLSACGARHQETTVTPAQNDQAGSQVDEQNAEDETTQEQHAQGELVGVVASAPLIEVEQHPESVSAEDGTEVLNIGYPTFVITIPGNDAAAQWISDDLAKTVEDYREIMAHGMSGESESLAAEALEAYEMSQNDQWGWETPYADELTATVTRCDKQVLSVVFSSYTYAGGAHGFYYSFGRCYDVSTGALLTLDNMGETGIDLKKELLDKVTEMSHDEEQYEPDMFFEDYEQSLPDVVDDDFALDGDGITFFAAPYELGAYAVGQIEFTVPYEELVGLVQSQYIFG